MIDIYKALQGYNLNITVYDPWANPEVVKREYEVEVINELPQARFDAVVLAVAHDAFNYIDEKRLLKEKSILYDVKGFLSKELVDGRL